MTTPTPTIPDQLSLIPTGPFEAEVKQIRLDQLPADSDLPGDPPSADFRESVATFGILQPIIVQEGRLPGRYTVAAGRRRVKAARAAGMLLIPAVVYPNDVPGEVLALVENQQRSRNLASDFIALKEMLRQGATESQLVKATGMPIQTIRARLRLGALIPAMLDAFLEGRISASVADAATSLSKSQQEDLLDELDTEGKLTLRMVDDAKRVKKAQAMKHIVSLDPALFGTPSTTTAPASANTAAAVDMIATVSDAIALIDQGFPAEAANILRRLLP